MCSDRPLAALFAVVLVAMVFSFASSRATARLRSATLRAKATQIKPVPAAKSLSPPPETQHREARAATLRSGQQLLARAVQAHEEVVLADRQAPGTPRRWAGPAARAGASRRAGPPAGPRCVPALAQQLALLGELVGPRLRAFQRQGRRRRRRVVVQAVSAGALAHQVDDLVLQDGRQPRAQRRPAGKAARPESTASNTSCTTSSASIGSCSRRCAKRTR